jgi:predicted transcriptional regulator
VPSRVTTVLSILKSTVLVAEVTVEVIPVPPANVRVSVARAMVSVPVSPAIPREVVIEAVEAAVKRP